MTDSDFGCPEWEREDEDMNIIAYALFAYGLTIVISLFVIGIIVLLNKLMMGKGEE